MQKIILQKKDKLEEILEDRIGFGRGQKSMLESMYLLLFSEGAESIVLGLMIPELDKEWGIGTFEKSLLITMVYIGVGLGSYLQTYSDVYGRYKVLLIDAIIACVFGLVSVFSMGFNFFLFARFFYGIGIGMALPITATYMTEIVPGSKRAFIMSVSRIYWSGGCVFACLIGWLLMGSNHWRIVLLILSIPNFIALYQIIVDGKQSIRFLWAHGKVQKCKVALDFIAEGNNRPHISYQELKQQIQNSQLQVHEKQEKMGFGELFNQKYKKQTLILIYSWASCCFNYYALVLILPSILASHSTYSYNGKYIFIIIVSFFQIVSFYFAPIIMDNPSFGRRRSIYLGTMLISVFSLLIMVVDDSQYYWLLIMFIFIKVFVTGSFMILYPYSAEIYETKLRGQAMGIFSVGGRIATAVMGMIGISSLQWLGGYGFYIILAVNSGLNSYLINKMPYCTLGRSLDS